MAGPGPGRRARGGPRAYRPALRLGWQYLYIAVFDGVRAEPVLRRDQHPGKTAGNGLVLVLSLAQRWGFTVRHDGKMVRAASPRLPD